MSRRECSLALRWSLRGGAKHGSEHSHRGTRSVADHDPLWHAGDARDARGRDLLQAAPAAGWHWLAECRGGRRAHWYRRGARVVALGAVHAQVRWIAPRG